MAEELIRRPPTSTKNSRSVLFQQGRACHRFLAGIWARPTARALAQSGADVVINGRDAAKLAPVVKEIESLGVKATAIAADLGQRADVERLLAQAIATARPSRCFGSTTPASFSPHARGRLRRCGLGRRHQRESQRGVHRLPRGKQRMLARGSGQNRQHRLARSRFSAGITVPGLRGEQGRGRPAHEGVVQRVVACRGAG